MKTEDSLPPGVFGVPGRQLPREAGQSENGLPPSSNAHQVLFVLPPPCSWPSATSTGHCGVSEAAAKVTERREVVGLAQG